MMRFNLENSAAFSSTKLPTNFEIIVPPATYHMIAFASLKQRNFGFLFNLVVAHDA